MLGRVRPLLLPLALWLLLVLACVTPQKDTATSNREASASGEALPTTASAYEITEPWATEHIETVALTKRFARRTFKDPKRPDNWHELIIGTGNDSEKVYAYFHFVPLKDLEFAEHDTREMRWGLLFGKYAYLANIPVNNLKDDFELVKKCKDSAPFFYMGLHDSSGANEGVDIRGIHLAAKRYKGKGGLIIGVTSDEWNDIRHAVMRGEKHELYSLFP